MEPCIMEARRTKMFLTFSIERATLSCTVSGECDSLELILECAAGDGSGVLEIGEKHIFASKKDIRISSRRRKCGLRIYIKRKISLSAERIAKIGLSDEKIGELGFYPEYEAKDVAPGRPASIEASVFVTDPIFENILAATRAGKRAEVGYLYIEKKGILAFGWEPDGSRIVWKIDDPTNPSFVDVSQLEIQFAFLA
jgi:hypothetical protein